MVLKVAKTGQMLIGDAVFAAQQDVDVPLPTGGPWVAGRYTVAGLAVTAEITTIIIDTAANTETYSCTIRGVTFTFTSDGSATLLEIRDQFPYFRCAHRGDGTRCLRTCDRCVRIK